MRIRKEISPWDTKKFIRIALILFVLLNGIILFLNSLSGRPFSEYTSGNWVFGLLQPVLLASVFTYHARKISLYINDYQNIEAFQDKVNQNILSQGMRTHQISQSHTSYASTGWFYKLFNQWGGLERVTVQWGNEIVIEGSPRIVSQVEDSLTWNPAFK